MIQELFCTISDKLRDTGLFTRVYEYCELVQRVDGTARPMYNNSGGFVDVQNFDVNGTCYIRKRGNVTLSVDTTAVKRAACTTSERMVRMILPLRLVCAIPKLNEPLTDDIFALELIALLQSETLQVASYDTDAMSVWASENKGISFDYNKVYKYSYFAIDFNAVVKTDVSCLKQCEENGYLGSVL